MTAWPALPELHDGVLAARVQHRIDHLTKPLGALGRLEALALQVALIQGHDTPELRAPQLVVFAADHGIAAHGVSAYPAAVTAQMVLNMLAGGAAVSVLARAQGLALTVVDCGVDFDFAPQPGLVDAKVCRGCADSTSGPALTAAQCDAALVNGMDLVRGLPGNVLLLGEMGIGNTSAAALMMVRLTGLPLADCMGRGTGLDDIGLARKSAVLQRALARHAGVDSQHPAGGSSPRQDGAAQQGPLALLAALGGAEIATMTGAVLQAAAERRVLLVDGFITTAAVALAAALAPAVLQRCVFAHGSAEHGHGRWLEVLGVQPLLDLGLRLGEGSGAALAWPLLAAAVRLLNDMASFGSAGVAQRGGPAHSSGKSSAAARGNDWASDAA